ncbi:response regulator transcription factor [Flavobacterium salilacus subsp. salilacus]|uniref:response regulator transcription factor n=1 Tax=Flavobacterium TaxID=237 RepID=UPI00107587C4|nr:MULTISPECIES: response regulator transcription factor [Flavobacterium]KAF2518420.1 response regulator transcription factor [Flavobacterium salilacus subsp. salilacus]MBE1615056.1 response regulator transcription factor [Flavobacterium sp. SaA2.13]NDI98047.1 response regulator transcription factor [Flavobacterium salilacus subsp. altitudinum]
MINLVIAEDHQSLIDGIKIFLEYEDDICVVGEANDGERLLEIVHAKKPDVVLTDIRMPKIDGITATKMIKKEFPQCHVIAFSMFEQNEAVTQMEEAGASGYVVKNSSLKTVANAIRGVMQGEKFFDASLKKAHDKNSNNEAPLSKRELEIVNLVGQGKTSQEIADLLFIGKTTVDTHRKNILKKLNLQGKSELLRYSMERKYDF